MALADAVGERYRALILLATFAGLRLGELDTPAPPLASAISTPRRTETPQSLALSRH
jgi:hypothetical protein